MQDLEPRGQCAELRARDAGELGDALAEHEHLGLGAVADVVGDQLADAPHPRLHRPGRVVGGLHGGDEAQVLVELEDQGIGVLLHGGRRVEDPGHGAQPLGGGRRDTHPGGHQGGHLARQGHQRHVVQGGEAQGRQLRGQLATTELAELVARGAPGLKVALLGAHPAVDLLDPLPGRSVHRLDPHRQVPLAQRHDGGKDPVVQAVHGTVGDVPAGWAPSLQIVPDETEQTRRHVQVTNDVVRSPDETLARVTRQRIERPVCVLNDAFEIRGGKEDVLRIEQTLVTDLRLHGAFLQSE